MSTNIIKTKTGRMYIIYVKTVVGLIPKPLISTFCREYVTKCQKMQLNYSCSVHNVINIYKLSFL